MDQTFSIFPRAVCPSFCLLLCSVRAVFPVSSVQTAGHHNKKESLTKKFMELLSKPQMNDFTVLVKTEQNKDTLAAIAPFTKEYPVLADKTSCYLCRGGACQAPVFDAESLETLLQAAD